MVPGHVYGSTDKWTGLGVFFDSWDNDRREFNIYFNILFLFLSLSLFFIIKFSNKTVIIHIY